MLKVTPHPHTSSATFLRHLRHLALICTAAVVAGVGLHAADATKKSPLEIVKDGQGRAEIVIAAENRSRMTTLAALELRKYVELISGAQLPIVTAPTDGVPVKIFVGESPATEKLGITAKGMEYGAYRMVSGPDWLVLIGKDFDMDPAAHKLPLSRGAVPKAAAEWAEAVKKSGLTTTSWGYPFAGAFKAYWAPGTFDTILNEQYGEDAAALWTSGGNTVKGFWEQDGSGSMNAVHALLKQLGVRHYMPGELGRILPKMATISVGPIDESSKPDFAARTWRHNSYGRFSLEDVLWPRRLGMNSIYERSSPTVLSHWLVHVHQTDEMKAAHPEYYALIGGKRDTEHRGYGTACFSSEGLVKEAANFARFLFDECNIRVVSLWPGDGLRVCECDLCKGKNASELVWGFTDKVAREVYKTHPDKFVMGGAYTIYSEPPDSIEKFSPNVIVSISNSGRLRMNDPEHWADYEARTRKWASKVEPGNLLRGENNRYHIWGVEDGARGLPISYPAIHPLSVARDIKFLKTMGSYGEDGEQAQLAGYWKHMPLEHITLYPQSQLLWDADQDVNQILDEYCNNFYGPAAKQMREAIDFAEKNLALQDESRGRGRGNPMNVTMATAVRFRDLLDKAMAAAGDTVYGQRIQAIIDSLQPRDEMIAKFKAKETETAQARAKAPLATGVKGADLSAAPDHKLLKNSATELTADTTFKVGWDQNALLLDIVCKEPNMQKLLASQDVHSGDYLAISIETQNHSYYHIEVNPDGVLVEGDPAGGWKSLTDLKTEKGPDFWRVQMRIPVVGTDEAESDPYHRMAGSMPTAEAPWYFNVGRARMAGETREVAAFSPTGGTWRQPLKFGRLEIK